jgi:PAS domain S-box-containing protein
VVTKIKKLLNPDLVKLLSTGLFLPVIGSLLSIFFFHEVRLSHETIHTIIELVGGITAYSIAIIVISNQKIKNAFTYSQMIWLVCSMLSMGTLDIFHAFSPIGNNFVWLHSAATCSGGIFFALMLGVPVKKSIGSVVVIFVLLGSIAFGALSISFPEYVPIMVIGKEFTFASKALNFIGGAGFLAATYYFVKHYLKNNSTSYYYLAVHCLLFGSAGILFEISSLWDLAWWWWHVLRLAAYFVLIFFYLSDVNFRMDTSYSSRAYIKENLDFEVLLKAFVGVVAMTSLLTMIGWLFEIELFIQLKKNLAPMQFNTALGFLLCSVGAFFHVENHFKISKIFGSIVLVFSSFFLIEYIFNFTWFIDNLFVDATKVMDRVSHAGRPSPNTSIAFTLCGLILMKKKRDGFFFCLSGALGFLILLTFSAYLIDTEGIYGLGALKRMAIHTMGSFALLCAIFIIAYYDDLPSRMDIWTISPFFVATVSLVLSLYSWYASHELMVYRNREHFLGLINRKVSDIKTRFSHYEQALMGGVGFIKGSNNVDRKEWEKYVEALELGKYLPGTNGIGMIDHVLAKDLPAYLKKVRADRVPDFKNKPNTKFKDKFIIKYIEPANINGPAIGLDIGFEKNRRLAAEKARDTGNITLTEKILLVQDDKKLAGFLLLAPYYKDKMPINTVEQRRKALIGWVYSPFMARNFLSEIINVEEKIVTFYEEGEISEDNIIYVARGDTKVNPNYDFLTQKITIELGGRKWTSVWQPSIGFVPKITVDFPSMILSIGLITTTILFGVFYLLSMLYGRSASEAESNRKKLNSVFNKAVDSIITLNEKGHIENINRSGEKMFGYKKSELLGRHIKYLLPKIHNLSYLTKQNEGHDKKSDSSTYTIETEVEGRREDKSIFPVEFSITQIKMQDTVIYTIILRDITQRKSVEKMKTEFISTVNHELRTPLTSIQASLGLLKGLLGKKLDKKTKHILDLSYKNSERLASLVNDILDIERIAAGRMDYNMEIIEVCKHVQDVVEQNSAYADKYVVKFVTKFETEEAFVKVDENRLGQAIVNLLSNAAKFSKEKGVVTVSVAMKNQKTVRISVADNGIGISKEFGKRIFQKFAQEDGSNTRQKGGSGLGLSITKSLVEAFKGKISFDSKVGIGTTFYIDLPAVKKETENTNKKTDKKTKNRQK